MLVIKHIERIRLLLLDGKSNVLLLDDIWKLIIYIFLFFLIYYIIIASQKERRTIKIEILDKHITIISGILSIITSIMTICGGIKNNVIVFVLGIILTLLFVYIIIRIKQHPKYTEIEGLRIEEADDIPVFVPKKNRLNPLNVIHTYSTVKTDATLEYEYMGVCIDKNGVDCFSTGLRSNDINTLDNMIWFAYDLKNDPDRSKKISPDLQSPDGLTKKVVFKFLKRIKYNQIFHYYTFQTVKNTIRERGKDYFVSTVLYKNRPLCDYQVILKFVGIKPSNISVYSVKNRKGNFLYNLLDKDMIFKNDTYIYTDNIEDETAWSIRVYIFNRETENETQ